jgi:broad specificity phosphatase PhoE
VSNTKPLIITVLRHGAVDGRAQIFRGASAEGLTAQGIAQMEVALLRALPPTRIEKLANRLSPHADKSLVISQRERAFDTVATSPLRRCHEFAASYAQAKKLPLQVLPCFSELNFGDWEGLTPHEAEARNYNEYMAFSASNGVIPPPNGEALFEFCARIAQGWHDWLQQDFGEARLLITHAGVMRGLLMELFGFTPAQAFQFALPEAACMRISHLHGHTPFLLSLN